LVDAVGEAVAEAGSRKDEVTRPDARLHANAMPGQVGNYAAHRKGGTTGALELPAAGEKPKWRAKRTQRQRAYQPWRALSRMRRGRVASMPDLHEKFIGFQESSG